MIAGLPFPRFRALTVMLLFVAALLVGSIDAVACEPEIEQNQTAFVTTADADDAPAKGHNERGDACVHGHCHAGSQVLASSDPLPISEPLRSAYNPVEPSALGPPLSNTDERPPRA
jgi:hypothetical protein